MTGKTRYLTSAALIAAAYAALTYVSAAMGLAYSAVQFRLSEVLTVLPLFTPAAVPGLAVGCILSDLMSTASPVDILIGPLATLIAAKLTRLLRHVRIGKYPFLSLLMPVLVNGVMIGAELTVFYSSGKAGLTFFLTSCLSVAFGEAVICFVPGSALAMFLDGNDRMKNLLDPDGR